MEMKSIKVDSLIKRKVTEHIPDYLIEQRQGGGGKTLSYLAGATVTDMLNDAFGYAWSWEVKREWIQASQPYFNSYTKSREKVSFNGKEGAWEEQGPVANVLGTLTVYLSTDTGIVELKKDGYGSKSILGKQNDQESIFKAAGTDALKKAASLFGIGLELYRNEHQQAYFEMINYENPWTDETREQFKEYLDYIDDYKIKYQVSDDAFAEYVGDVTQTTYELNPDNIVEVYNNLVEALKEA